MDDLDRKLHDAFRRQAPSPGFEARVLAAAARTQQRRPFFARFAFPFRWAAVAAAMVVSISTFEYHRESVERAKGEAAKAQLELALRITSEKLKKIQNRINTEDQ